MVKEYNRDTIFDRSETLIFEKIEFENWSSDKCAFI